MTSAIAMFTKFYAEGVVHGQWQNFFIGKTIDGHDYMSFDVSEILMNRSADEGGVTLTWAATSRSLETVENAITGEHLAEIIIYEKPVVDELPTDLSGFVVIARFIGEIIAMNTDLTTISVEIGASIDAVSGDIPGRKITTSLVGRLPSL